MNVLPNTLLYGNCIYFSKRYNVAFESVLVKIVFPVYQLIAYIAILSGAQNDTKTLTYFTVSVIWVDILLDLSFDGFGYFLVFLDTIARTITTRRSTKITLKVIVLVQMFSILTYA